MNKCVICKVNREADPPRHIVLHYCPNSCPCEKCAVNLIPEEPVGSTRTTPV